MEHTDDVSNYVVIYLTKEKSVDKSLNSLLLQKGFAKLDKNVYKILIINSFLPLF